MSGKARGSGQENEDAPQISMTVFLRMSFVPFMMTSSMRSFNKSPTWPRGLKMLNNDILNHVLKMMMMISLRRTMATWRLKPKLNDVLRMHITIIS